MKHSKNGELFWASLIKEEELCRFVDFLKRHFDEISFAGKTSDGTRILFMDIEELLEYPNNESRRLISLEIACNATDRSKGLGLEFGSSRIIWPKSVTYSLRYEDRTWGFAFEDDLKQELKELKAGYSWATFSNLTLTLPIVVFFAFFLFILLDFGLKQIGFAGYINYSRQVANDSSSPSLVQLNNTLWASYIVGLVVGFASLVHMLRNYLYPVLFIALGRQYKEYEKRRKIANILFVTIGLAMIVGIITNIISNALTNLTNG